MAFTTTIKNFINACLAPGGLKLDTMTLERRELERLSLLDASGYFDKPVFPLQPAIRRMDCEPVLRELSQYRGRFQDLQNIDSNPVGYTFDNNFFSSPDAEVLYTMVRTHRPRKIVEVGCGNSTKVSRLAIMDGNLDTELVTIDPEPRSGVAHLSDRLFLSPVEDLRDSSVFVDLAEGDILFIDSSHELKVGNDIVRLYLEVIPQLQPGVLIHIHDIFLPYDYRREFAIGHRLQYGEQYLVQTMLQPGTRFEVLWAGYYLQKTRSDFETHFEHIGQRNAQSFWIRNS